MARESRRDARARIEGELMDAARRQLADVGAAGLSLREVARELGMVSSAVYRYVASRDELLTRLIIEAYDELGEVAERASADAARQAPGHDLDRWLAIARAVRAWALDHPQQYLLLYGSPVPGYAAPEHTVAPGTRVTLALVAVLGDAQAAGRLEPAADGAEPIDHDLAGELRRLAATANAGHVDEHAVLAFLAAWTQMFGLISFELTNQTRNMVTDHLALFDATIRQLAHHMGLR